MEIDAEASNSIATADLIAGTEPSFIATLVYATSRRLKAETVHALVLFGLGSTIHQHNLDPQDVESAYQARSHVLAAAANLHQIPNAGSRLSRGAGLLVGQGWCRPISPVFAELHLVLDPLRDNGDIHVADSSRRPRELDCAETSCP